MAESQKPHAGMADGNRAYDWNVALMRRLVDANTNGETGIDESVLHEYMSTHELLPVLRALFSNVPRYNFAGRVRIHPNPDVALAALWTNHVTGMVAPRPRTSDEPNKEPSKEPNNGSFAVSHLVRTLYTESMNNSDDDSDGSESDERPLRSTERNWVAELSASGLPLEKRSFVSLREAIVAHRARGGAWDDSHSVPVIPFSVLAMGDAMCSTDIKRAVSDSVFHMLEPTPSFCSACGNAVATPLPGFGLEFRDFVLREVAEEGDRAYADACRLLSCVLGYGNDAFYQADSTVRDWWAKNGATYASRCRRGALDLTPRLVGRFLQLLLMQILRPFSNGKKVDCALLRVRVSMLVHAGMMLATADVLSSQPRQLVDGRVSIHDALDDDAFYAVAVRCAHEAQSMGPATPYPFRSRDPPSIIAAIQSKPHHGQLVSQRTRGKFDVIPVNMDDVPMHLTRDVSMLASKPPAVPAGAGPPSIDSAIGVRCSMAALMRAQRCVGALRLVCKQWADTFKAYAFRPYVECVDFAESAADVAGSDALAGAPPLPTQLKAHTGYVTIFVRRDAVVADGGALRTAHQYTSPVLLWRGGRQIEVKMDALASAHATNTTQSFDLPLAGGVQRALASRTADKRQETPATLCVLKHCALFPAVANASCYSLHPIHLSSPRATLTILDERPMPFSLRDRTPSHALMGNDGRDPYQFWIRIPFKCPRTSRELKSDAGATALTPFRMRVSLRSPAVSSIVAFSDPFYVHSTTVSQTDMQKRKRQRTERTSRGKRGS